MTHQNESNDNQANPNVCAYQFKFKVQDLKENYIFNSCNLKVETSFYKTFYIFSLKEASYRSFQNSVNFNINI